MYFNVDLICPILVIIILILDRIVEFEESKPYILLLLAAIEGVYIVFSNEMIWFLRDPDWWVIAINFCVFAWCMYRQALMALTHLGESSDGNGKWGVYTLVICVIGTIVELAITDRAFYGIIALGGTQLIQAIIIGVKSYNYESLWRSFINALAWLAIVPTTLVLGSIVVAIGLVIYIILGVLGSSSSSRSSSSSGGSSGKKVYGEIEAEGLHLEDRDYEYYSPITHKSYRKTAGGYEEM